MSPVISVFARRYEGESVGSAMGSETRSGASGSCLGRVVVAILLFVAVGCGVTCVADWRASRRAETARSALKLGAPCSVLTDVALQYGDPGSVAEAHKACREAPTKHTVLFSSGLLLTYLVEVTLDERGQIRAVSEVGAW